MPTSNRTHLRALTESLSNGPSAVAALISGLTAVADDYERRAGESAIAEEKRHLLDGAARWRDAVKNLEHAEETYRMAAVRINNMVKESLGNMPLPELRKVEPTPAEV